MSKADVATVPVLEDKAIEMRKQLCTYIYKVGGGHAGGELSMMDFAVALYYRYMKYDPKNPEWEERDRFILSKGHCGAALWMILADLGLFTMDHVYTHYQAVEKGLFGMHSNRKYIPGIEVSTGSLGHGLPIATGLALGARAKGASWRTFCLLGDGELNEGTNWEAFMAAGHYQTGNLVAIVDKNQLQASGFGKSIMSLDPLAEKIRAFGWDVREINGNDMTQVCNAFDSLPPVQPDAIGKPVCIIGNTIKGRGVSFMELNPGWHMNKLADEEMYKKALGSIESMRKGK